MASFESEKRAPIVSENTIAMFDCDDNLYVNNWRTAIKLTAKIEDYCITTLGLEKGKAYALYQEHGTCLKGLLEEGILDESGVDAFLEAVHDIDLSDIAPDPELRALLLRVRAPRWVFTASVASHARRCLERLGVADLFGERIIDCKSVGLVTKHSPSAFADAMRIAGARAGADCVFTDDSPKNLRTAKAAGWHTVLVGLRGRDDGAPIVCDEADFKIETIHALPDVIPELFAPPPAAAKEEEGGAAPSAADALSASPPPAVGS